MENRMTFEDLKKFIEFEDTRLTEYYGTFEDKEKVVFSRAIKVTEEVGELCSEILAKGSLQRKGKIDNHSDDKLAEELVDVIITLSLLANSLDIDIETALKKKIEKINKRHEKNKEIKL